MLEDSGAMTVALEWMAKAENDLKSAAHLLKLKDCPTDTVCFHAQQCVEKYIKALLVAQGRDFRRTHDIGELLVLLPARLRPFLDEREQDRFTEYATVTRYPGDYEAISLKEARQAVTIARRVRREIRRLLEEKPPFKKNGRGGGSA
jgi:HEPN domain-containing protein